MRAIDPIFVKQRPVARAWGASDTGQWLRDRSETTIGEAWILDAANASDTGPLGRRLAAQPDGMLGDLGRAPPRIRLVFPGQPARVTSTAPLSFWTILEPGVSGGAESARHRPGERIRTYEGAEVSLAAGSVAIEVSPTFIPANASNLEPQVITMPPVSYRARASLVREDALSVETWLLPEWSRVVPDGETCHVLTALSQGVTVDGRKLGPGEAVFVPAWGRPLDISAAERGCKLLVAYADRTPTAIWQHTPGPDPAAGQLPAPQPERPPLVEAADMQRALAA
jgi:hypothetical protein